LFSHRGGKASIRLEQMISFFDNHGLLDKISYVCLENHECVLADKGISVISIDKLVDIAQSIQIIVPMDVGYHQYVKSLEKAGIHKDNIVLMPLVLFWHDGLQSFGKRAEAFFDSNEHFILYGLGSSEMTDLLARAGVHIDGYCANKAMPCQPPRGIAQLEMSEVLRSSAKVICYGSYSKKPLIEQGIPESRIYQLANLDFYQYFDYDIVPCHRTGKREVFVDAGVRDLETSRQFLDWCNGECERIYAFEASPKNLIDCKSILQEDSYLAQKTELIGKGIYSEPTELYFYDHPLIKGASHLMVSRKISADEEVVSPHTSVVSCTSIDEALKGKRVTFIKFDIEGSELAGLKGASETIKTYHPILAISAYHKREDILTLPSCIKEIDSGYQLYLRCYHENLAELVLYGIWKK